MSSQTIFNWLEDIDDEISDGESLISYHESESEQGKINI